MMVNFLNQFTFAVASVKWESIRMFLLIFLQSRCGMWQFTHIYRWSEVLDLFPFGFTKNLLLKKREPLLTLTPMGDPGWKRLLSICILRLFFQGEVNLDSPEEILAVTGGYQEVLSHLNLFLLWSDKGGLGFGSCESLGWSVIPFVVAEMPFLNSMSGQKFSSVALTKTSFYLVTPWEERTGWDGI